MKNHWVKWMLVMGTIYFLVMGQAWADGKRGPGNGNGQGYHSQPQPSHGQGVRFHNPPHYKPVPPPAVHGKPRHGHGHAYAQGHSCHHGCRPQVRHHVVHHYRPAPPVVHYYPAPPAPAPMPAGGFLFSALVSEPGFALGVAIGDNW